MKRGLGALESMQNGNGSFSLFRRTTKSPWQPCHPLFATLAVLLAVGRLLPAPSVARAVRFVAGCRRGDGTWEYDPAYGIPSDSDDTACALIALARHAPDLLTAADPAILRSFWRADGGPFQTWRGSAKWTDRNRDDVVVNCNILAALGALHAPPTPEETDSVLRLIRATDGRSRYYCFPASAAYAARRAGFPLDRLPAALLAPPERARWALPTAQWLAAKREWDEEAVGHLLALQRADGRWPAEPWCSGAGNPRPFWGGPAVSTALCVEGLWHAVAATRRSAREAASPGRS